MIKHFKRVVIAFICLVSFLLLLRHWMVEREEEEFRELGGRVISAIEDFRTTHNRLPENELEFGMEVTESGSGPYYVKRDSNKYMVCFGVSMDQCYAYDSETKEWKYTYW